MAIEWIIAGAFAALGIGLGYIFWDELKAWAISLWDFLVDEILANYIVDAITGGLVTIIKIAGGLFKKTRFYKRAKVFFTSGRKEYYMKEDVEVVYSDLPKEIRHRLDNSIEVPVLTA